MSTLAERITIALSETDLTQADLARACGIKPPSVWAWFNGDTKNLKGKNLVIVARLLNVSESWLASGIGKKQRDQGQWPFKVPFADYERLTNEQKDSLNLVIESFFAGAMPYKSESSGKAA